MTDTITVPTTPTKVMWDGLARQIMMWIDTEPRTARSLFEHLKNAGKIIPDWLKQEPEMQNLDHTPSKGTRCVLIYQAMIHDYQQTLHQNPPLTLQVDNYYKDRTGITVKIISKTPNAELFIGNKGNLYLENGRVNFFKESSFDLVKIASPSDIHQFISNALKSNHQ